MDADPTRALAVGDVDGDGDADVVLGNAWEQARLYLNEGTGVFRDASEQLPAEADGLRCVVKVTEPDRAVGVVEWCPANPFLDSGTLVELFETPDEQLPVIGAWGGLQ